MSVGEAGGGRGGQGQHLGGHGVQVFQTLAVQQAAHDGQHFLQLIGVELESAGLSVGQRFETGAVPVAPQKNK